MVCRRGNYINLKKPPIYGGFLSMTTYVSRDGSFKDRWCEIKLFNKINGI